MNAKTFLAFYLTFLILALAGIGLYQNLQLPAWLEYVHIAVMLAVVGIGLYQAYLKIRARRSGHPADDEHSLGILYRAGSGSFLLSIYLWGFIIYAYVKSGIDAGILFGAGILGMAFLFALTWLFYKIREFRNA